VDAVGEMALRPVDCVELLVLQEEFLADIVDSVLRFGVSMQLQPLLRQRLVIEHQIEPSSILLCRLLIPNKRHTCRTDGQTILLGLEHLRDILPKLTMLKIVILRPLRIRVSIPKQHHRRPRILLKVLRSRSSDWAYTTPPETYYSMRTQYRLSPISESRSIG
jgi:hypothetical protein